MQLQENVFEVQVFYSDVGSPFVLQFGDKVIVKIGHGDESSIPRDLAPQGSAHREIRRQVVRGSDPQPLDAVLHNIQFVK